MDYEAFCSCQGVLVFVLLSMEIDSKLLYAQRSIDQSPGKKFLCDLKVRNTLLKKKFLPEENFAEEILNLENFVCEICGKEMTRENFFE